MARITQVVVTCDLEDGDVSAAESVSFSYGGKTYTLDLCKKHLDEVKGALEGFASAGHAAGRGGRGRRRAASTGRTARAARPAATPRGESQAEIREWRGRRVMRSETVVGSPARSGRLTRLPRPKGPGAASPAVLPLADRQRLIALL